MTNEELVALIQAGDHVQENMGQLYQQSREFIVKIALPFSNVCELEDLVQEAYFGLEKAVYRYDPSLGFKFLTYADDWIRRAIQRYCQNNGRVKRLPSYLIERISKYQKYRSDFRAVTQGEEPTDEDYCGFLEISPAQLKNLRKYMVEAETVALETPIPDADGLTVGDSIPDDFDLEETVCDAVGDEQAKAAIWGAVADLGGQKADVIQGQYLKGETLEETGSRMEISKERVRQIKNKALKILRINRRIIETAEIYGYGSSLAYHGGIGRFKETGSSITEYMAIKNIEIADGRKRVTEQAQAMNSFVPAVADRMQEKFGEVPVGILRLEELNAEIEAKYQAFLANRKQISNTPPGK